MRLASGPRVSRSGLPSQGAIVHAADQDGARWPDWLAGQVAAVSVGVVGGEVVVDLDYAHDSTAEVDMNVVMRDGDFVEIQGTGEQGIFDRAALNEMLDGAVAGISQIQAAQRAALGRD